MSESLSDAVREAAEIEAIRLCPMMDDPPLPEINRSRRLRQKAFRAGAVWVAGRLPGRDEIAEALFGEYGCDCGDALESHSPLDREDSYRGADKILALIREHVTRG